jgi:hypothetical protein
MTLGGAAFTSVEKTQGHSSCLSERAVHRGQFHLEDTAVHDVQLGDQELATARNA